MQEDIIKEAPCLLAIGCFCIGTNHIALEAAANRGVHHNSCAYLHPIILSCVDFSVQFALQQQQKRR